jgi:hypothetical protein
MCSSKPGFNPYHGLRLSRYDSAILKAMPN